MHPHPHPHHAIRAQDEGGGQQERQGVYSDLESARWAAGGVSRSEGGGGQSIQSVWADANAAWLAVRQDALRHLVRAAPHLMLRGAGGVGGGAVVKQ